MKIRATNLSDRRRIARTSASVPAPRTADGPRPQQPAKRARTSASVPVPPQITPADLILHERYVQLTRRHLEKLPALFTKLTGLSSHVAWAPRWPGGWNLRDLPTRSRLCRAALAGCPNALKRCGRCATHHLAQTLESGHSGHRFTCWLGIHSFWLPIIVRGHLVGLAFVQAPAKTAAGAILRRKARRAFAGPTKSVLAGGARSAVKCLSRSDFWEAAQLLHLVFDHVETSALAELRKSDLTQAQQALVELQSVATRLRKELNGLVPAFSKASPLLEPESHTDRVIRAALEYIHRQYSKPFTLRQCARELCLNAAYLSAQFSRAVGIPFKTYLTEVRIEKARMLLGNPATAIADVACAVGYASENRFRLAFKQVTGLPPRLWRGTLRMERHKPL